MMIYRKRPTSYIGRLTSVKEAITQFDMPGKALVMLPNTLIDQVRTQYAWFEPQYYNREKTARVLLDHLDNRRQALHELKQQLSNTLQNFQLYVKSRWAKPKERRTYFNLNPDLKDLGLPSRDTEVVIYASLVLKQEAQRRSDGCKPLPQVYIDALEEALEHFEKVMQAVALAHHEYFQVQADLVENLKEFDEVLLALWGHIDIGLRKFPKPLRRRMAKRYGVIYVVRAEANGPIEDPSENQLAQSETQADGSDGLFDPGIEPGQDPADDLGVEDALREAGLPLNPNEMASGGANDTSLE